MHDGLAETLQIASEIECLNHLVPFEVFYGMYYESFFVYGMPELNPALQDYIFEDSDTDVAIIADGPEIYVISSCGGYDMKCRVLAERVAEKLVEVGLNYERWRSDEYDKRSNRMHET